MQDINTGLVCCTFLSTKCCTYCRDDVEWGEEQKREAEEKVAENSHDLVAEEEREGYEAAAAEYWDNFYQQHQNK